MRCQHRVEENYQTMEAVVNALRRSAGIYYFLQILSPHQSVFFLDITNIHKVMCFVGEDISMTRDNIARVIQAYPTLLKKDTDKISYAI